MQLQRHNAFSLIELMIALVIVGILAAIAWPSYRSYLQRAHQQQAEAVLRSAASRLEHYYLSHQTYATATWAVLGEPAADDAYRYSIESHTNDTYILVAIAKQPGGCSRISLTSLGVMDKCLK